MKSRAWAVVGYLAVAFAINYIDRQVVFSIFPVLRRELSFTDAQLGLAGGLFTWTYSLAMPLSGRIADLVRRDRMIASALVLWSLATLGTGLSQNVVQFMAWRVVMGLTEALYVPAAIGLITQAHPGATRSRALSLHGLAQFGGVTLGGWYGGWAADHIGWRLGFMLLALVGISYAGILLRRLPEVGARAIAPAGARAAPLDVLRSACYLALTAAFFGFCALLWMLYAWLPNAVYERYGLSLAESGLTATLYLQSSSAGGALLGGVVGDWFGTRHPAGRFYVVAGGLLGCAPFAWIVFETHSLGLLKLSAAAFGLFAGFVVANAFSSFYDVIVPRNVGLATGIMNLAGGLAGGAAMLVGGLFKNTIGIAGLMFWAAAGSVFLALALFVVVRARFTAERSQAAAA